MGPLTVVATAYTGSPVALRRVQLGTASLTDCAGAEALLASLSHNTTVGDVQIGDNPQVEVEHIQVGARRRRAAGRRLRELAGRAKACAGRAWK
jgi:hypothetical protein